MLQYSFSLTTFSPSGKLVQIEYALNAVEAGATSLGIKATNGVVIATERKVGIGASVYTACLLLKSWLFLAVEVTAKPIAAACTGQVVRTCRCLRSWWMRVRFRKYHC
jgi:Proteasome subunit A N-terminal signature